MGQGGSLVAVPPVPSELAVGLQLRRNKRPIGAILGATWLILVILSAVLAQALPLPKPASLSNTYSALPGWHHLLGTDGLGRDVLSRIVFGARGSMAVAVGATTVALLIGVPLGMISGFFRGATDSGISLFVNFMLSFPPLIFLIAVVTALKPGIVTLVVAMSLLGIPNFARVARANTIALADREFVTAARALGASPLRILRRELLANVMLPVLSLALVVMASLVVAEGTLSFLGLGIPPPTPSWGGMLAAGRDSLRTDPQLVLIPALCFFFTVLAFNNLGDWARSRVGRGSSI
jgi:peptide/nickel transport system permease protein